MTPSPASSSLANPIHFAPFSGSQMLALSCPAYESCFHGSRGTGKSEILLLDFYQDVFHGYGPKHKGLIVRKTFPELKDLIDKSLVMFRTICPGAKYNASDHVWTFPSGSQLIFGYLDKPKDYLRYHGHEFQFFGVDELTSFATMDEIDLLKSTVRSPRADIPLKIRYTTNPSGPGHANVKARFIDRMKPGQIIADPRTGLTMTHLYSNVIENVLIVDTYLPTLLSINDPNRRKAWTLGTWDITAGGAFDDLWRSDIHVIQPFKIPSKWYVDRSYDHGESAPGSCLWWAESNGEEVELANGKRRAFARGTLFLINEWWIANKQRPNEGLRLTPHEIAEGIKARESGGILAGLNVRSGPADNAIFDVGPGRSDSIAKQMEVKGIRWERSDKRPGSRKNGVSLFRQRLKWSERGGWEGPGFYAFQTCPHFVSNVPILPRDDKDPDDVDSDSIDHDWDSGRYRMLSKRSRMVDGRLTM